VVDVAGTALDVVVDGATEEVVDEVVEEVDAGSEDDPVVVASVDIAPVVVVVDSMLELVELAVVVVAGSAFP
jgi:hypothetical protein